MHFPSAKMVLSFRGQSSLMSSQVFGAFQVELVVRNLPTNAGDIRDSGSIPWSGRSPGGGKATTPVFLPGEYHGQRSLAGSSP